MRAGRVGLAAPAPARSGPAKIEIRGIGKRYEHARDQPPVLDGIDLAIEYNEFVTLIGRSGRALLFRVALPAAAPDIATGLRIGWGLSFSILVTAELIAADEGLGVLIMIARHDGEVGVIVFGILLIGTTNLVADYLLAALIRRRIGRWHPV